MPDQPSQAEDQTPQTKNGEQPEERDWPEPAPTDFRRNIWLLLIILGVVVVAWLLSLASG